MFINVFTPDVGWLVDGSVSELDPGISFLRLYATCKIVLLYYCSIRVSSAIPTILVMSILVIILNRDKTFLANHWLSVVFFNFGYTISGLYADFVLTNISSLRNSCHYF